MKVVIITGSAHRHGTTAALADKFQQGAVDAGHEVFRFDAAFKSVHPCLGCDTCRRTGSCVFDDDMKELNPHLQEADAVVFVSPVYYFSLNAQIKAVIDRFYANDDTLHVKKKSVLITAMADTEMISAESGNAFFHGITDFFGWEPTAVLNAKNAYTPADLTSADLEKAYELGKDL